MLPRATAIDDKKGQEVGAFRPHFYNAWMAFTRKRAEGSLQIGLNRHPLQVLTVWLKQSLTGLWFLKQTSILWPGLETIFKMHPNRFVFDDCWWFVGWGT